MIVNDCTMQMGRLAVELELWLVENVICNKMAIILLS